MNRIARLTVLATLPVLASCADSERNPFDPADDATAPALVNFEIEVTDQKVFALWSASEPVRAVFEYTDAGRGTNHHSYPSERAYAEAGITKLLGLDSDTRYTVSGVRLTDRAGNETVAQIEEMPSFTTAAVADEDLLYFAMIDVGWGDAHYLEAPDGTRTLVDAGHPQDGMRVRRFLERRGVTSLDFASMTHVHEDHIGGFYGSDFPSWQVGLFWNTVEPDPEPNEEPLSFDRFPVGTFLDILEKTPNSFETHGPYNDLVEAIDSLLDSGSIDRHVSLGPGESSVTNEALRWGDELRVDLVSSGRKGFLLPDFIIDEETGSVQNNDSMVYRVQFRDFVILLTGDGEFATEQYLQDNYTSEFLRSTVLKLGHHGSNDANSERFVRYVDPVMALIPNAISENSGVEHPFVLQRLRNLGIDYFASDRVIPNRDRALPGVRGNVQIYTDGYAWTVVIDDIKFE